MKRPAQPHYRHKETRNQPRELKSGFFHSPMFHGLVNLLPMVVVISVLGIHLSQKGDRRLFLKLGEGDNSPALLYELSLRASNDGDIKLGQEMFDRATNSRTDSPVLGVSSELEEKLWPQLRWQREWQKIEGFVGEENSAKVLLRGAFIKEELGEQEKAAELWEKAWKLDPNDSETEKIKKVLNI